MSANATSNMAAGLALAAALLGVFAQQSVEPTTPAETVERIDASSAAALAAANSAASAR